MSKSMLSCLTEFPETSPEQEAADERGKTVLAKGETQTAPPSNDPDGLFGCQKGT